MAAGEKWAEVWKFSRPQTVKSLTEQREKETKEIPWWLVKYCSMTGMNKKTAMGASFGGPKYQIWSAWVPPHSTGQVSWAHLATLQFLVYCRHETTLWDAFNFFNLAKFRLYVVLYYICLFHDLSQHSCCFPGFVSFFCTLQFNCFCQLLVLEMCALWLLFFVTFILFKIDFFFPKKHALKTLFPLKSDLMFLVGLGDKSF